MFCLIACLRINSLKGGRSGSGKLPEIIRVSEIVLTHTYYERE
jgi:hypothetical protein